MNLGEALLAHPTAMKIQLGSRPRSDAALNNAQRLAVNRYLKEGFGYDAIAMTLGVHVNAIKHIK